MRPPCLQHEGVDHDLDGAVAKVHHADLVTLDDALIRLQHRVSTRAEVVDLLALGVVGEANVEPHAASLAEAHIVDLGRRNCAVWNRHDGADGCSEAC